MRRPAPSIRPAAPADRAAVWTVLEPAIRAGDSYALPRGIGRAAALGYWFGPGRTVFLAEAGGEAVGTYYLCANQRGGGGHVANCGYVTARAAQGRGVARAMCAHSLRQARARGFRAMQFNFVVASNSRAVALWKSLGFRVVGRIPGAFRHPSRGLVDALVMHRRL
jgi:ribosomal protein S18 acetylase RimI-like enzyme